MECHASRLNKIKHDFITKRIFIPQIAEVKWAHTGMGTVEKEQVNLTNGYLEIINPIYFLNMNIQIYTSTNIFRTVYVSYGQTH